LRAASDLGLDLGRSTLVGDRGSDLRRRPSRRDTRGPGAHGLRLGEWEYRRSALPVQPDHVADDLLGAADWVIKELAR